MIEVVEYRLGKKAKESSTSRKKNKKIKGRQRIMHMGTVEWKASKEVLTTVNVN